MEQLTKLQIIDETVTYYSTHARSIEERTGDCKYNNRNGNKCAFSRCCTDNSTFNEGVSSREQINARLLPQYAHIPITNDFWLDLQEIHDRDYYWNKGTLDTRGELRITELKEIYSL